MTSSLCPEAYGSCSMYEHRHCVDCGQILYAPDYDDARGDEQHLVCKSCSATAPFLRGIAGFSTIMAIMLAFVIAAARF